MYKQLSFQSKKTESKVAKAFRSVHEKIGFVMMFAYRMNWEVLLSVFVEYFETEDMSWNLRVDNDG